MFAKAVAVAQQFTRPVVISRLHYDGSVASGMGAFVVINHDGWIITAAHLFQAEVVAPSHKKEIAAYEAAKKGGGKKGKGTRGKAPKRNPKWLVDHSYWWSANGVSAQNIAADFDLDIAIAQLDPFDPSTFSTYPRFKDAATGLAPGTSLCKLGYPFHEFAATHVKGGGFQLPAGAIPAPFFPLEGIFTRNVQGPKTKSGNTVKFIETSSPGLRGQSGGPIFDTDGVVWGIQSRTQHFDLGFSPTASTKGKNVEEHQFLNVGWGVHPEVIHAFLKAQGISFAIG